MRNKVFRGMLVTTVPATDAARCDVVEGAAARAIDALIAALDGQDDANRLLPLLRAERPRLVAIRSEALLSVAINELLERRDVNPLEGVAA
jgi:hypothetical protein